MNRSTSRNLMTAVSLILMNIAILVLIYYDLPTGVAICLLYGVSALAFILFAIDAIDRREREQIAKQDQ